MTPPTKAQALKTVREYIAVLENPVQPIGDWDMGDADEVGYELANQHLELFGRDPQDPEDFGIVTAYAKLAPTVVALAMRLAEIPA